MTAQIGDKYRFNDENYAVVAISERVDWHPTMIGLQPRHVITACWRGYWCGYEVSQTGFFLEDLYIHTHNDKYPKINGKKPVSEKGAIHQHYEQLHIPINYNGNILVGAGFMSEHYIHGGLQRFWGYKTLLELMFVDGKLVKTVDYSALANAVRNAHKETGDNIYNIIQNPKQYIDEFLLQQYECIPWWFG